MRQFVEKEVAPAAQEHDARRALPASIRARLADLELSGPNSLEQLFVRATEQPDYTPVARNILDVIQNGRT